MERLTRTTRRARLLMKPIFRDTDRGRLPSHRASSALSLVWPAILTHWYARLSRFHAIAATAHMPRDGVVRDSSSPARGASRAIAVHPRRARRPVARRVSVPCHAACARFAHRLPFAIAVLATPESQAR